MTNVIHDENNARSTVPASYDVNFILEEAGYPNHAGWMVNPDGSKRIVYHPNDHQAVIAVIDDYEALFVEKKGKPDLRKQIGTVGRAKVLEFSFGGMPLVLDASTEARITGAVAYLERNPAVTELHWDLTGDGDFITLPRENVLALGDAAGAHVQAVFSHRKDLTDAVNAATTIAELEAVDLESNWP
jgi:hypothetical protein